MTLVPPPEGSRVYFRPITPADGAFYHRLVNSEGWIKNIGDRGICDVEAAEKYLTDVIIPKYGPNGLGSWVLMRKDDDTPLGIAGFYERDYLDAPDVGFALLPEFYGNGYAREAVSVLIRYASECGRAKVPAIVNPVNERSLHLLDALGFKHMGLRETAPGSQSAYLEWCPDATA